MGVAAGWCSGSVTDTWVRDGHERKAADESGRRERPLLSARTHLWPIFAFSLGREGRQKGQQADTGVRLGRPVGPTFVSG